MIPIVILTVVLYIYWGGYLELKKRRKELLATGDFAYLSFQTKIEIFLSYFLKKIKTILFVGFLIYVSYFVYKKANKLDQFITNQKRIEHLSLAIKQLSKRYKVAEMKVLDIKNNQSLLEFNFFDNKGKQRSTQDIKIKGTDIYFDAVILNFEYSKIESGGRNIALPFRVYSEKLPKSKGIALQVYENEIPYLFEKEENEIYGMDKKEYETSIKEIVSFIENPIKARKSGVRSIYGNSVHRNIQKENLYTIWIEQTGGLTIKKKNPF